MMTMMTWTKRKNSVAVCISCTGKTKMVIPGMTIFDLASLQIRIGEKDRDGGESRNRNGIGED